MTSDQRSSLATTLQDGARELGLALDAETEILLLDYLALLVKWNSVYNLTAIRAPEAMVHQHLLDSLAALPAFADARRVLDVGTGAGLPGMVLAICARQATPARPAMRVDLIDPVHKKTAFLTQVKVELGLENVSVHTGKVQDLMPSMLQDGQLFDVITSRAFAEIGDFISWSQHLLAPGGKFVAMKGQLARIEEENLPAGWEVSATTMLQVPGLDAQRHLVEVRRSEDVHA